MLRQNRGPAETHRGSIIHCCDSIKHEYQLRMCQTSSFTIVCEKWVLYTYTHTQKTQIKTKQQMCPAGMNDLDPISRTETAIPPYTAAWRHCICDIQLVNNRLVRRVQELLALITGLCGGPISDSLSSRCILEIYSFTRPGANETMLLNVGHHPSLPSATE